ncbi:hypothetical protein [Paenibacillus sacheonensis]|uniref:HAD family hydrolase n=1 Tax=Paenibacillus sacheonensis TaxID=742054 RepID=A0A7X4YV76_9BACL|nr:hypothetical protein [Paenibacillus sacheonensis]MBM7566465.1 putative HAD superfamily hydrolase [Paenibacillus sacheonensis]NBC73148.1 hypothetical protein [Paenibacillus sacheonensis]
MKMLDERQQVTEVFQASFGKYQNQNIVIYGIGKNTEYILDCCSTYNIIGLMDEARTGDTIYGKPVLTYDQAVKLNVDIIIIVARSNNLRIIYRRIGGFCTAHSIRVYDIYGNLQGQDIAQTKSMIAYNELDEQRLRSKIIAAEVVSFDVFDTLVMRQTLYPQDIFYIMQERIEESDEHTESFANIRIKAERELYREGLNPNLTAIYNRIQEFLLISDDRKQQWQELEVRIESEYLLRRESMCELLAFATSLGKEVYLVSDMYLPRRTLYPLLSALGIRVQEDHLFVSCDFGVSKEAGLFKILTEKTGYRKTLHIGDNEEADIRSAERYGIHDTFHIKSALNMLEDGYANELLKYDSKLSNRLMIGEFIARQLNNPFLYSETNGKFRVDSPYEMAYAFIAPVVYRFFSWIVAKAKELDLNRILFSARDGYLLEAISQTLRSAHADFPRTQYFYTSRAAAVPAGLYSEEDILFAAQLAYSGSVSDMLRDRFHLKADDIQPRADESDTDYVRKHKHAILRQAVIARDCYSRYLDSVAIPSGARVGFFDFVSSGTCQRMLSNVVDFELYGLYFSRINAQSQYKSDSKIEAMYDIPNIYEPSWHFLDDYFFMENILTSFEPSLLEFDKDGKPVFATEHRTAEQFDHLTEVQIAIKDYVQETKLRLEQIGEVDLEIPDLLIRSLREQYSIMRTNYFETEALVDAFTNRNFSLKEG